MASVYGQHLYSENRYSWLTEWSLKPCEPDVWYKTGYVPQDWALEVCNPATWFGAACGPVPPNQDPGDIQIPVPASGSIAGEVRPVGSLSGKVGTTGTIAGVVRPVGHLSGVFIPEVKGTITGLLRPVGNLQGKVLDKFFVGILPQFGPIHHASLSVSTVVTPNDTETVATIGGTGTGLSSDRIPADNVVWKFFVPTASIDARICIIEERADTTNLQHPPGFAYQGMCYMRNGHVYDGFDRPVGGPTWGSGAYLLMAYNTRTGQIWIGTTDLTGANPVWFGDPLAGTGHIAIFPFTFLPHVAIFGVGSDVFRFLMPASSELPGPAPLGIHGVVHPVGSLGGTFVAPPVTGTITGTIQPVGALHGLVTVPAITGTITGVVRPAGSLSGVVTAPAVAPVVALTASGLVNGGGTFNNVAIGAATSDRLVVVCVGTVRTIATPGPVTAVTINGVAATKIASVNSLTSNPTAGIFAALVPTGTTCNIVCTVPGGADNISAQVYTVKGLTTPGSAYHTATSGANDGSVALNIPANGVAIGVATGFGSLSAYTWTGLTKDYDAQLAFNNFQRSSTASRTGMSAETGRTISISGGGANDALTTSSWL